MPKLENWSLIEASTNPFIPLESKGLLLRGQIYNDERFPDGTSIVTSRVQQLDITNRVARTNNTTYLLGEPSEDYSKWLKDNSKDSIFV